MNYALNRTSSSGRKSGGLGVLKPLLPFLAKERRNLTVAFIGILLNVGATLAAPAIIGHAIDRYVQGRDLRGLLLVSALLLAVFVVGLVASYTQVIRMGTVGRNVLFDLRNEIFIKLQELPVAFFNQNKVGDLISRINNDTDRLNQFFSQGLMQLAGSFFMILGAGIFLLALNPRLGAAALLPALGVLVATRLLSPWVKKMNLGSLQALGGMSAEIQESLENFKVIVAFNRLDYFRDKFGVANEANYKASIGAGLANNIFIPIYALAGSMAQLIVLAYGITLISAGSLTIGLLIGFLLYVNNFYSPLRQLAAVWTTLQQALAALDRISEMLDLTSDLAVMPAEPAAGGDHPKLSFQNVTFRYPDGPDVLRRISFALERGKTYALVGPTGGGKTTTASLMARLYDPTEGIVRFDGRDLRSYEPTERAKRLGFILQEPFLFAGTLLDNLFYGHPDLVGSSAEDRLAALKDSGLGDLLANFEKGPDTPITSGGEGISLGQRQLVAFVRAVLRKPEVLILDEATANIDTVTEQLLERALEKLPKDTTKVIIAHRLNTIENADEIFFVNGGEVKSAGSFDHAVEMLMHGKRST